MTTFTVNKIKHISVALWTWAIIFAPINLWADCPPLFYAAQSQTQATSSFFSGDNRNTHPIKLLAPGFKSKVTTTTPTFTWRSVPSDSVVEYRVLVAWPNGKVIIDQWVGTDTVFSISPATPLDDLKHYHWLVHAYAGKNSLKSKIWSFWIDRDLVTDLKIDEAKIISNKNHFQAGDEIQIQVQVQNCGPEKIDQCFLLLFSGNTNRNYFDYSAQRKTAALDTLELTSLELNVPKIVTLRGIVQPGLNHFNVRFDPGLGFKEIYWQDNFKTVAKIQTEKEIVRMKGLFVIYTNYFDPKAGLHHLNTNDRKMLSLNIAQFQNYFWDHTQILKIDADTIQVPRTLKDEYFIYQNDNWGYVLPPAEVAKDLQSRDIDLNAYDFVFAFYSWWNSNESWSGYGGYIYGEHRIPKSNLYFLAQPTIAGKANDATIAIHEFIHLLDLIFEQNGDKDFYSPHHKTLYTTFTSDTDYFEWMLETWPSEKWFHLNQGEKLLRSSEVPENTDGLERSGDSITLLQNYPNPFNQMTTFTYKIPAIESFFSGARVSLVIYDLLGNRIQELADKIQKPGTYQAFWDGRDMNNREVATGIYFYELRVNRQRQVKKLLIIR